MTARGGAEGRRVRSDGLGLYVFLRGRIFRAPTPSAAESGARVGVVYSDGATVARVYVWGSGAPSVLRATESWEMVP